MFKDFIRNVTHLIGVGLIALSIFTGAAIVAYVVVVIVLAPLLILLMS